MPNTLTALQPILFSAAQMVSREMVGILPSIYLDSSLSAASKGDVIKIPVAPVRAAADFTPAATTSAGDDATATAPSLTISKSRKVSWHLTGEQMRSLDNGGNSLEWTRQLIAQGMRTLCNEAEADAAAAIKAGASRAYGTAGTTPFASDLSAAANILRILKDNGAPTGDGGLTLAIDSASGLNLRGLANLVQAYQAGSDVTLRQGALLDMFGLKIKESAGITTHTKGTGASYVTSGSTAKGVTDIALVTGTGTVLAGDVVTFAADSANKYVINTGVSAPGTISLGRPGARVTIATANAMTIGNSYAANVAFHKMAVVGAVRPPEIPANPIIQSIQMTDLVGGLPFTLLEIAQYGQKSWELHLAWGFQVVNPEHVAILLG